MGREESIELILYLISPVKRSIFYCFSHHIASCPVVLLQKQVEGEEEKNAQCISYSHPLPQNTGYRTLLTESLYLYTHTQSHFP